MSRPGVFFTTRADGALDIWDLHFRHQEPTLRVQVSPGEPLTALAGAPAGERLAVGAKGGAVTVLHLSRSLWVSPREEKAAVVAVLERESLRCVAVLTSRLFTPLLAGTESSPA
jgi:dynein intermediate chain 2, axonemal